MNDLYFSLTHPQSSIAYKTLISRGPHQSPFPSEECHSGSKYTQTAHTCLLSDKCSSTRFNYYPRSHLTSSFPIRPTSVAAAARTAQINAPLEFISKRQQTFDSAAENYLNASVLGCCSDLIAFFPSPVPPWVIISPVFHPIASHHLPSINCDTHDSIDD